MTRIRKLFLGIFLMVFALGIGVFIFVQVDSKDAGTGKSRPLSMAEIMMRRILKIWSILKISCID